MRKSILVMAALAAVTMTVCPVKAQAKVYTVKEARHAWYQVEKKAYKNKKTYTRTYTVKDKYVAVFDVNCYKFLQGQGNTGKVVRKGKNTKVTLKVNGKDKKFRKRCLETISDNKIIDYLKKKTKGKNQIEKASIVGDYVAKHAEYKIRYSDLHKYSYIYPQDLLKGKGKGYCTPLADCFYYYATKVGVKHVGEVWYKDHAWNYFTDEKGNYWYYDQQDAVDAIRRWRCTQDYESCDEYTKADCRKMYGNSAGVYPWETTDYMYEFYDQNNFTDKKKYDNFYKKYRKICVYSYQNNGSIYFNWYKER